MKKIIYRIVITIAIISLVIAGFGFVIHTAEDRSLVEVWNKMHIISKWALVPGVVFGLIALLIEE